MKKNNRKGFTTVELVIVIAVIAILAAVLIPTFANLIHKANVANDTAVARNLNTAVAMSDGNVDTFEEALAAVRDAGYLIANLNASAEDCYIIWEDDSNQFLLYDLKNSKVIYSNTDGYGNPDASWSFAVSSSEVADTIKASLPNITIKNTVANPTDLFDVIEGTPAGEEVVIYIDDSFRVDPDQYVVFDKADSNIVLNLSGSTVTADYINGTSPYQVKEGTVTFENGKLNGSSSAESWDEACTLISGFGDCNVNVDNTVITLQANKGEGKNVAILSKYGANVTVSNTTVYAGNSNPIQCYGGTLILDNVIVDQTGASEKGYYNSAIQVVNGYGENAQYKANLTVNSGTYNGKIAIQISAPGGNVTINGGTFTGTDKVINADLSKGYYDQGVRSVITINGGTFNGAIKVSDYTELVINGGTFTVNPTEWLGEGHTVTANSNGTYTVK